MTTLTDDPKQWLRTLMDTVDNKQANAFAQKLSEDVEFVFGNCSAVFGRRAVAEFVDAFFATIDSSCHVIEDIICVEHTLIFQGHVTYTRKDSSTLIVPFSNWLYIKGDKVSRYLIFADTSGL
jgi:ketosteroid isomerase-like protein